MPGRAVPLVGVTTYSERAAWGAWDRAAALLPDTYVQSVVRAGGRPVLLPPTGDEDVRDAAAVIDALDAVVLVGGGDVDPARYGQGAHATTAGVDARRDAAELALVAAALDAGTPILAICRGMQVLNVHLGGTLCQHLPDVLGTDAHRPAAGCFADVAVHSEPGSLAAKVLGERTTVRCSHHQALDDVGAGLVVTSRAADGVVEAVELPSAQFVLGVQWHPEEELDLRLFQALVEAAPSPRGRTS
jgi:gamma-glutamyl-gamma-aminobutyrate hydrolase PuuD